jgi:hypothetical protein
VSNGKSWIELTCIHAELAHDCRRSIKIGITAYADFCKHDTRVTSGRPAFRASPTHGYALRISPDMGMNLRCTSSSSTLESVGNGFARPRAAHLRVSLGLDDVSVRSLAAWTGHLIAGIPPRSVMSQASSPRFVASPQLPSSST